MQERGRQKKASTEDIKFITRSGTKSTRGFKGGAAPKCNSGRNEGEFLMRGHALRKRWGFGVKKEG